MRKSYFNTIGLSTEDANRGFDDFYSNCELRWKEGAREPGCPPNTTRTDIQRKRPKSKTELIFKNERKKK
jgi:hypothetical protein